MSLENEFGMGSDPAAQSSLEDDPLQEQEFDAEITPSVGAAGDHGGGDEAPEGSDGNLAADAPAGDARLTESPDPGRPSEGIAL